jgi:uncharacterized membrane protein YdbT with pleckstrin-like domain
MKKLLGNLWFWVISAFLLVIIAWVWTFQLAKHYDFSPIDEETQLERQPPS